MAEVQIETDVEQAKAQIDAMAQNEENSLIAQEQPKQAAPSNAPRTVRPVKAKPKKKAFGQKFKEAMFGDDIGDGTIAEHIFFRIFIPSIKRVISDMANSAINMALGLDPRTRTIRTGESHVANASVYRDRNLNRSGYSGGNGRRVSISEYEWDEETAKDIFNQLNELIEHYGNASVGDAYSIMGMGDKIRSTDRNWGWTSMRNADVYPLDAAGERWIVDMPPARPI